MPLFTSGLLSRAYSLWRREGLWRLLAASGQVSLQALSRAWTRYRVDRADSIEIECRGHVVRYDTQSELAKEWFYPRYLNGGLHEPAVTHEIVDTLDQDSVFYDVGALVGWYTVLASEVCTSGSVHAFELDPEYLGEIQRSLSRNGTTATVNRRAVAEESGERRSYSGGIGLTGIDPGEATGGDATVETIALDDYVTSNPIPDVLKLDVEGFEYDALLGAQSLLDTEPPDVIVLEVHPPELREYGHSAEDVLDLLAAHQYAYRPVRTRDDLPASDDLETSIDQYRNVTFVCRCEA